MFSVTNTWLTDRDALDIRENKVGTGTISKYDYSVNGQTQRESVAMSGSAFAAAATLSWGYDELGQVVKADHPTAAKDFGYTYDWAGNRKRSSRNTVNPATATGVNLAVYRQGNATSAEGGTALNQYGSLTLYNTAAVTNTYDADGNQILGRYPAAGMPAGTRTWDGENRLIQTVVTGGLTSYYTYDAFHRRVASRSSAGTDVLYTVYDEWNPVADYKLVSGVPALNTACTWGSDLSGTFQGAGGVGGLLAVKLFSGSPGTYYPTYDGNGNVSEYLNAGGGFSAHYEYGPFGELTASTGPLANAFRHRFSTKPFDPETGYCYYGYRLYDPLIGRWLSRDPIGERGGANMFAFCINAAQNLVDVLGAEPFGRTVPSWIDNIAYDSGYMDTEGRWRPEEGDSSLDSYNYGEAQRKIDKGIAVDAFLNLQHYLRDKKDGFAQCCEDDEKVEYWKYNNRYASYDECVRAKGRRCN